MDWHWVTAYLAVLVLYMACGHEAKLAADRAYWYANWYTRLAAQLGLHRAGIVEALYHWEISWKWERRRECLAIGCLSAIGADAAVYVAEYLKALMWSSVL